MFFCFCEHMSCTLEVMIESESSFVDYYAVLGVQPHVTESELKKAYTTLAREQHPDVGGSDEQMQLVNKAYATLKDDTKRRAYDLIHQFHTGTAELHYRASSDGAATGSLKGMSDEEIDEFVNSVFKEYSAPKAKETLRTRVKQKIQSKKQM